MLFEVLKSKIHMGKITEINKEYEGSITIDERLALKADILPYEKVLVSDVENGNRFETYVIYGKKGEICVNGAAANLVKVGDRVIIMSFALTPDRNLTPKIIKVDENNNIIE
ncbi:MAG: aspartate 1-decarboxylase [candidate division WOR-3 bacterium]